jgi:hypothetical protein
LSVAKDLADPEKRFGRVQLAAILLGLAGFAVGYWQLSNKEAAAKHQRELAEQARAAASETLTKVEETKRATDAVQTQTAGTLTSLGILKSELQDATTALRDEVQTSTKTMKKEVAKSTQDTTAAVDRMRIKLGKEVGNVQSAVTATTLGLTGKLTAIDNAVAQSQATVVARVKDTADDSVKTFEEKLKDRTKESIAAFDESIGRSLIRVPFAVGEHQTASLLGELAGCRVKAGEIRGWASAKITPVSLTCGDKTVDVPFVFSAKQPPDRYCGPAVFDSKGNPKYYTPCIKFQHNGKNYRLEMLPRTPTNLFGQSDDTLVCQVIPDE